jgi:hypothetical protein
MNVPRRRILQSAAGAAGTAGSIALAGCQSLTETQHLLVVENETDTEHVVTVVVRRATDSTTSGSRTDTDGTSTRFVVDFRYEMGGGMRREGPGVLPAEDTYEVVASVTDVGTGRTAYTDRESVRVTVTGDGVTVDTFAPN